MILAVSYAAAPSVPCTSPVHVIIMAQFNWSFMLTVITPVTDDITADFRLRSLMAHFWTAREGLCAFELIGSRLLIIMAAAFTVFSPPVTARRRVQSGSEWCPDGLETLTVRQTSPATPQLCTLGELWSHPGVIRILPEALQHRGPGWYPLHVQTAETRGLGPRGACEPGERELVEIRVMMLIADVQIGHWVKDQSIYLSNDLFYSFAKIQLFEFLSGNMEVPEIPDSSVASTPSGKKRPCSSQVSLFLLSCTTKTFIINHHNKPYFHFAPYPLYCFFLENEIFLAIIKAFTFLVFSVLHFCLESILISISYHLDLRAKCELNYHADV